MLRYKWNKSVCIQRGNMFVTSGSIQSCNIQSIMVPFVLMAGKSRGGLISYNRHFPRAQIISSTYTLIFWLDVDRILFAILHLHCHSYSLNTLKHPRYFISMINAFYIYFNDVYTIVNLPILLGVSRKWPWKIEMSTEI